MRRPAGWAAWGLWTFDVCVAVTLLLFPRSSLGYGDGAGLLFILVFASTGALVASRIPRNPVGWLMSLAALCFAVGGLCDAFYRSVARHDQHGPLIAAAAWIGIWVWMLGFGPSATYLLLLFPDGRLPSRRWRPLAGLTTGTLVCLVTSLALRPGRIESTHVTNPLGVPAGGLMMVLAGVALTLLGVCMVGCCVSLVVRFRGARREQRQQLKWLAWSLPIMLLFLTASAWVQSANSSQRAVDIGNALSAVGLMAVPVAIACAILRSRLYDIDVVINRTLVYGSLTAALVATYVVSILLLRAVLSPVTGQSDLAVAGSTLAVAALFRPARSRIQAAVDHHFYRRRYDAARTLQSFNGRLRQEVDLDTVSADLRSVVLHTMQPAHVSLWLRSEP